MNPNRISNQTAKELVRVSKEWATENEINPAMMLNLIESLSKVKGNSIFSESMQEFYCEYEKAEL